MVVTEFVTKMSIAVTTNPHRYKSIKCTIFMLIWFECYSSGSVGILFFFFNLLFGVFRLAFLFVCFINHSLLHYCSKYLLPSPEADFTSYDFRFSCVTGSAPARKKIMHQAWPCDFFWPVKCTWSGLWHITQRFGESFCISTTLLSLCYKSGNISEKGHSTCLGPRTRKGTELQWFVKDIEHECKR